MEDILEVYHRKYDSKKPLICMDETSKQLTKEIRVPIPVKPGKASRYDTEYERNGVGNLFIFFEPLKGKRYIEVTSYRKAKDWAHQIKKLVDEIYPEAEKIVLVMDNLNTHSGASLYKTFSPKEARRILSRLEIHYTPKHGSWLNMAEIEFSVLNRQCLNRRIANIELLKEEISSWEEERNMIASPMSWQFSLDEARTKLKKLYPTIQE